VVALELARHPVRDDSALADGMRCVARLKDLRTIDEGAWCMVWPERPNYDFTRMMRMGT
jgi:hypothetical protein